MQKVDCDISEVSYGELALEISEAAHQPVVSSEQRILTILRQELTPEAASEIWRELELLMEDASISLAATALRHIIQQLNGTSGGEALRIVLLGQENTSIREVAQAAGCSHVAIVKQTKKLRARLNKGLPSRTIMRGDSMPR